MPILDVRPAVRRAEAIRWIGDGSGVKAGEGPEGSFQNGSFPKEIGGHYFWAEAGRQITDNWSGRGISFLLWGEPGRGESGVSFRREV